MADHIVSGRLAKMVAEGPPGLGLAQRTCEALREQLGADGASVTLENLTVRRVTWCTTDERSEKLENLQDVLGEGPCRDAFTSLQPVTTGMDRWAASGGRTSSRPRSRSSARAASCGRCRCAWLTRRSGRSACTGWTGTL